MNPKTTLKIFVSSPGNHDEELRLTRKVVKALHGEYDDLSTEVVYAAHHSDDRPNMTLETGEGIAGLMISLKRWREIGIVAPIEAGKIETVEFLGGGSQGFVEDALFRTSVLREYSLRSWNSSLSKIVNNWHAETAISAIAFKNSLRQVDCSFHPSNRIDYFAESADHGYSVHFPLTDRYHLEFGSVFFAYEMPVSNMPGDEKDEPGETSWNPLRIGPADLGFDEKATRYVRYLFDGISEGDPQPSESDEYPQFIDAVFYPDPFRSLWEAAEELEKFDPYEDNELEFTIEAYPIPLTPREENSISSGKESSEEEFDPVEATLGAVVAVGSDQLSINRNLKAEISEAEKALLATGVDKLLADASSTKSSPQTVSENY